jgi:hypothetical protein
MGLISQQKLETNPLLRHFLNYLSVMQTSRIFKTNTPDKKNQADFNDKIYKPKPINEMKCLCATDYSLQAAKNTHC